MMTGRERQVRDRSISARGRMCDVRLQAMIRVYLIAAPEDETPAEALADYLKRWGFWVRIETGKFGFPPARHGELTLALWSRSAQMSSRRMILVNRAIDAWEDGRLVMAKLDPGFPPHGLGDLEMVDLTFEPARVHRYRDVADALRAVAAEAEKAKATPPSPAPGGGGTRGSENQEDTRQSPAPPPTVDAETDELHLFVSYSHDDGTQVFPIVEEVEQLGHTVWIDREQLHGGVSWAGRIVRAIKASRGMCLMCSERSFASDHVRREVYLADKYKKPLLPVRLDNAAMPEDIEYFLIDRQWIDATALSGDARVEAFEAALSGAEEDEG